MIVGIISKEDHAKSHAKGLMEDGHTVVLLGAAGERIPDNLEVMVCRIGSCSHRGSAVAREWKRKTGLPLIVEDGLAGIRRQLHSITVETTGASTPTPAPASDTLIAQTHADANPTATAAPMPEKTVAATLTVHAGGIPLHTPPNPTSETQPEEPVINKPKNTTKPIPNRHISRGPYADWTREKRVGVLTQIFRENPEMSGPDAWKLHEDRTAPRSMDRNMIAEARRVARGDTTRIATVPTSEVPAAVLAATPANAQPTKSAPTDVKELVQLLRVAMEAEGIERLTVTKDTVSFRRVVVEEGTFDV